MKTDTSGSEHLKSKPLWSQKKFYFWYFVFFFRFYTSIVYCREKCAPVVCGLTPCLTGYRHTSIIVLDYYIFWLVYVCCDIRILFQGLHWSSKSLWNFRIQSNIWKNFPKDKNVCRQQMTTRYIGTQETLKALHIIIVLICGLIFNMLICGLLWSICLIKQKIRIFWC